MTESNLRGIKIFSTQGMTEERDVIVLTDNKPLQYAFLRASEKASERQRR